MKIDRRLLFTLLPLLVFTLGDLVFEPIITSLLAIGLLLVEIVYNWLKYRKIDSSLWVELALISLLTLVDYFTQDTVVYKELFYIFCLALPLVIGKLMKKNLLIILMDRYLPSQKLSSYQRYDMEHQSNLLLIALCVSFLLFSVLQVITFVYGVVFPVKYISFGLLGVGFIALALINRARNIQFSKESWVPVLLEDGSFECSAPRSVVHNKSFLLHPVVHLHLVQNGKIYLQKRPLSKTIQPGKWDTAVGGHVDMGETIEQALHREAFEELGIVVENELFLKSYVWTSRVEKELVFTYLCFWNSDIFPNETELDGGKYWSINEIEEQKSNDIFTPNFLEEFELIKGIILASVISEPSDN